MDDSNKHRSDHIVVPFIPFKYGILKKLPKFLV